MQTNSKLIAIEGGDSAGKATQTKLLKKRLEAEDHPVEVLDFPQYQENQMGALIRECIDGRHGDFFSLDPRVLSTIFAVDRKETLPRILEWQAHGRVVLLDRYTSSNLLHQGAKVGDYKERQAIIDWIYRLEHDILNLPKPDMVIYLSVPAPVRMELLKGRKEKEGRSPDVPESKLDHQESVDRVAEDMLERYPNTKVIACMEGDALRAPEAIHEDVYAAVRDILHRN